MLVSHFFDLIPIWLLLVATILVMAFSLVIVLITDLDRPVMSFFDINHQLLVDLHEDMKADLRLEYYPGE